MTEQLLKCPFCGGDAIIYEDEQYNQYMIGCGNCCSVEPMTEWTSKENAIAQWNTRKPVEDVLERLKEKKAKAENFDSAINYGQMIAYRESIKIVKEGLK